MGEENLRTIISSQGNPPVTATGTLLGDEFQSAGYTPHHETPLKRLNYDLMVDSAELPREISDFSTKVQQILKQNKLGNPNKTERTKVLIDKFRPQPISQITSSPLASQLRTCNNSPIKHSKLKLQTVHETSPSIASLAIVSSQASEAVQKMAPSYNKNLIFGA